VKLHKRAAILPIIGEFKDASAKWPVPIANQGTHAAQNRQNFLLRRLRRFSSPRCWFLVGTAARPLRAVDLAFALKFRWLKPRRDNSDEEAEHRHPEQGVSNRQQFAQARRWEDIAKPYRGDVDDRKIEAIKPSANGRGFYIVESSRRYDRLDDNRGDDRQYPSLVFQGVAKYRTRGVNYQRRRFLGHGLPFASFRQSDFSESRLKHPWRQKLIGDPRRPFGSPHLGSEKPTAAVP
jgi:hypothetical protein